MKKANIILNVVGVVLLLWVILSTMEVIVHNSNESYEYSKANLWVLVTESKTETVTVIECTPQGNYYEVTVEDSKGNLWAYYDDEPKEMGDTLRESYAR